jgi:hypothetical protein
MHGHEAIELHSIMSTIILKWWCKIKIWGNEQRFSLCFIVNLNFLMSIHCLVMIKVKSTTSYSHFLMTQYNDERWIKHVHVNKNFMQCLTWNLRPMVEKKNMWLWSIVPVSMYVIVVYSLYDYYKSQLFKLSNLIIISIWPKTWSKITFCQLKHKNDIVKKINV